MDVDNRHSTTALTEHLIEAGRRRIMLVSGPTRVSCTARAREGYAEVMGAAGLPIRIVPAAFSHAGGRAACEFALRRWADIDAVIASCDDSAMGVIESLGRHGLRVPEDVAVTGFDDLPLARYAGITSVTHPVEAIANAAVHRLLARRGEDEEWFAAEPVLRRTA